MNGQGAGEPRWPTTAGGARSTPAQRAAAEAVLADIVTSPDTSGTPFEDGRLEISYTPFTEWGRDEDDDLSWYVQINWGTTL